MINISLRQTVLIVMILLVNAGMLLLIPKEVSAQISIESDRQNLIERVEQLQLLITELQDSIAFTKESVENTDAAVLDVENTNVPVSKPFDIIIVGGQSNAVGRGVGEYTEFPAYKKQADRIYQIARYGLNAGSPEIVTEEPLQHWNQHPDLARNVGLKGFAYPFALRYARGLDSDRNVLIVPVAYGGTSILQWDSEVENFSNGGKSDSTDLYDDMIERVKVALATHEDSRIAAVLWQHGEADTTGMANKFTSVHGFIEDAEEYGFLLDELRQRIRADIDVPCAPFLFGEMSREWNPVRGSEAGIASKRAVTAITKQVVDQDKCDASVFVRSFRATSNGEGDEIHFDANGQFQMARNYWGRYLVEIKQEEK